MAATTTRRKRTRIAFTEALGVYGWAKLDPILLGALAAELPVLLIGAHGTAKSWLVERIAVALGLSFRHYNASLVNYDDLVGIPLPDEGGERLRFVATPEAIWGAEFVFVDEISRCRPDLQNKLFPIVHERRVAGRQIDGLRHRWAAMNPPSGDGAGRDTQSDYLGSEPLDLALADRFAFVVAVPDWKALSKTDRRRVVQAGAPPVAPDVADLVVRTTAVLARLREALGERLAAYVSELVDNLHEAGIPQSPRRARTLLEAALAVQAAALVLSGTDPELHDPADPALEAELEGAASLAVRNGLPQPATGEAVQLVAVQAAHRQAWETTSRLADRRWQAVLAERDPLERVLVAREVGLDDGELSAVVTEALAAEQDSVRLTGMAAALFLALRERHNLRPSAWEPLVSLASAVLVPRTLPLWVGSRGKIYFDPGRSWISPSRKRTRPLTPQEVEIWRQLEPLVAHAAKSERERLEQNFLVAGFPKCWSGTSWQEALERFRADLDRAGIGGPAARTDGTPSGPNVAHRCPTKEAR